MMYGVCRQELDRIRHSRKVSWSNPRFTDIYAPDADHFQKQEDVCLRFSELETGVAHCRAKST